MHDACVANRKPRRELGFMRGHYVTVTLLCANQVVLQPIFRNFMDNLHYP